MRGITREHEQANLLRSQLSVSAVHHELRADAWHNALRAFPCVSLIIGMTTLHDKVPAGLDHKEAEVYRHLDPERLPKHIAIIMDGNGRWARRRHMPRVAGHRAGVASVRSTVETAARIHIPALTLYAFSEENWKKRPASEVDFLMRPAQPVSESRSPHAQQEQYSPGIHWAAARTAD